MFQCDKNSQWVCVVWKQPHLEKILSKRGRVVWGIGSRVPLPVISAEDWALCSPSLDLMSWLNQLSCLRGLRSLFLVEHCAPGWALRSGTLLDYTWESNTFVSCPTCWWVAGLIRQNTPEQCFTNQEVEEDELLWLCLYFNFVFCMLRFSFFGCTRFCINTRLLCVIVQYSGFIKLVSCYHNSLCAILYNKHLQSFSTPLIFKQNRQHYL